MTAVNPNEAPDGFYAVPKASLPQDQGNLCRQCDWRDQCGTDAHDRHNPSHRCMSHTVVLQDGTKVCRADGVSVVFKRIGE